MDTPRLSTSAPLVRKVVAGRSLDPPRGLRTPSVRRPKCAVKALRDQYGRGGMCVCSGLHLPSRYGTRSYPSARRKHTAFRPSCDRRNSRAAGLQSQDEIRYRV
jgi:hypothetical protein